MKKLLVFFCALSLVLTACQKEPSYEDPSRTPGTGGGTTANSLLTRSVISDGSESLVFNYTYDASKRIQAISYTYTGGGNEFLQFNRNSTGILTQYVIKSDDLASSGIDSIVTMVNYNNALSQYTSAVSTTLLNGIAYSDSTAYTYDTNGNIVEKLEYSKSDTDPYQMLTKTDYTYGGDNVASKKLYGYDNSGNTWSLEETFLYHYDVKTNPVKMGPEVLIAFENVSFIGINDDAAFFSGNNVTKFDYVDNVDATNNFTINTTYNYNSNNKPSDGSAVVPNTQTSYSLRYYYQ